jgi:acetyl-CoA C-acetyltransferase
MKQDDPRGQTVCGGLPYAGGPGNGYTLHAAASMVERLRSRPGELGLCTGNGWYLTKHSSTLLGTQPPTRELCAPRKVSAPQQGRVELVEEASGSATVETYTVTYDREGAPERGVVVGRLDDGSRFLANTPADRALNEAFVAQEAIGRRGRVKAVGDRNVFEPS